jgi:hypothetical protein
MRFTIDSQSLARAAAQLEPVLRRAKSPFSKQFILLEASSDGLCLSAWNTGAYVMVTLSAAGGYAPDVPGETVVRQADLLAAVSGLDGSIQVAQESGALVLCQYMPQEDLERHLALAQFKPETLFPSPLRQDPLGLGLLREEEQWPTHSCPTCGNTHTAKERRTYQGLGVESQEAVLLTSTLAQLAAYGAWIRPTRYEDEVLFRSTALFLRDGRLTLVTYGRVVAAVRGVTLPSSPPDWPHQVLVPTRALTQALAALPQGDVVRLQATFSRQQLAQINGQVADDAPATLVPVTLRLDAGDTMVLLPLAAAAAAPDYRRVLASEQRVRLLGEAAQLLRAVEFLRPSAERAQIRCTVEEEEMVMRLEMPWVVADVPNCYDLELAEHRGPGISLLLHERDLRHCLRQCGPAQVEIACTSPEKLVVCTARGNPHGLQVLLMPFSK